jgi:dihydroxyacetone kinase-like protein
MEIGIGIHGEPGRARVTLQSADAITDLLAATIFDDLPFSRGSRVIALVNGMGGTPLMELYIVFRRLAELCEARGITISRNLIGNYVTSLEMAGCSLTLLAVDDELLHWWDAPVHTPALRW